MTIGMQQEGAPERLAKRFYDLVVIGASSGGLAGIGDLLATLPADFPIPIAVVLHRSKEARQTAVVLGRRTTLRVKNACEGELALPRTVYLAPPQRHLIVRPNRTFHLMNGVKIKHTQSAANPLFDSAAYALGKGVIAVVLSGGGTDATDGVQAVKGMGGVVIAQDPADTPFNSMPRSAIDTGAVDHVVKLNEIAPLLVRLAGVPNG
jgi:two-component system, chemotaxis family, protein-glutamate methylesterase/glutaminase